jgi:4'-phosphopantetheinyl transferase EntD
MIPDLLPSGAFGAAEYEPQWDLTLLPEESWLVQRALPKRRREFAAARNCARRALLLLGESPGPILSGANRQPLWPSGVVGSITHCHDYCAAAVAYRNQIMGLGIDAERNVVLARELYDSVCTPQELRAFRHSGITADLLGADPGTLVFSAKESLYKAWYPITGAWLGFENAIIDLNIRSQCFSVRLRLGDSDHDSIRFIEFNGSFAVTEKHVFTVVVASQLSTSDLTPFLQVRC